MNHTYSPDFFKSAHITRSPFKKRVPAMKKAIDAISRKPKFNSILTSLFRITSLDKTPPSSFAITSSCGGVLYGQKQFATALTNAARNASKSEKRSETV